MGSVCGTTERQRLCNPGLHLPTQWDSPCKSRVQAEGLLRRQHYTAEGLDSVGNASHDSLCLPDSWQGGSAKIEGVGCELAQLTLFQSEAEIFTPCNLLNHK